MLLEMNNLLEVVFCMGFFIVPLIGMIALIIVQGMRQTQEEALPDRNIISFKEYQKRMKHKNHYVHKSPSRAEIFKYPKVVDYELMRQARHRSSATIHFKERINPRAGP